MQIENIRLAKMLNDNPFNLKVLAKDQTEDGFRGPIYKFKRYEISMLETENISHLTQITKVYFEFVYK